MTVMYFTVTRNGKPTTYEIPSDMEERRHEYRGFIIEFEAKPVPPWMCCDWDYYPSWTDPDDSNTHLYGQAGSVAAAREQIDEIISEYPDEIPRRLQEKIIIVTTPGAEMMGRCPECGAFGWTHFDDCDSQ